MISRAWRSATWVRPRGAHDPVDWSRPPRSLARWFVRHAVARWAFALGARRGDPMSRLMHDPAAKRCPFPLHEELRSRAGVSRFPLGVGVVSHAATSAVLRERRFTAGSATSRLATWALRVTADERLIGPLDTPSLFVIDPPEHTRLRRLVSGMFTPRAVAALRPRIERTVDQLLDGLAERDPQEIVDLVTDFAMPLPVSVIADLIGVPRTMMTTFLAWSRAAAPSLDLGMSLAASRRVDAALLSINHWLDGHLEQLRREPGEDLLSGLVALLEDADQLSTVELRALAQSLIGAGFVTMVDLLGSATVLLTEHPDQLAALRSDPAGWPNAVEEALRHASPVQITARFASARTTLDNTEIPRGGLVAAVIGAANRDPAVFVDPHRFDITRPNAREHLSFSRGAHHCPGAALARMETEIGLRRLFTRFPELRAAGPPTVRPSSLLRGYDHVPVRLGPAASATS